MSAQDVSMLLGTILVLGSGIYALYTVIADRITESKKSK